MGKHTEYSERQVIYFIPFVLVPIVVGHELTVYTTTEGNGQVELCVVIFDPPSGVPREFTLTINTQDGTAS